jgi:4-amino-4-deoxy-L-arabinose transferase-like glycosyltransferase
MPAANRDGCSVAPGAARDGVAWVLSGLTLLFHVATIQGYGYFRDELYYLANGEHLGFGYVEHPPFIGLVAAFVRATLGDSRFAIRLLPALAAAATVWIGVRLTREFGGGRFACLLAGLSIMVMPGFVGLFSIFSMNAFDILCWAACTLVVARILRTGRQRLWLLFGVLAGVGLENKISVLFLGAGVVAGLAMARQWQVFRGRWLWAGGAIAGALSAPFVVWQAAHGWPLVEFMSNARHLKNVDLTLVAFMREEILLANALALPVWVAGLGYLLFAKAARPFRPLGWIYPVVLLALLAAGDAKPYYLAATYTLLFAAGGVAVERWTLSAPARDEGERAPTLLGKTVRGAVVALVMVGGVVAAPLAKPVLPLETFVRYSDALGLKVSAGERNKLGRLPQMYADMQGWPALAETVAGVYHSLPSDDRRRACVFAQNYGQAGAIDLFGPRLGLPKAISGHNSYFLWGPRDCTGDVLIVIGGTRACLDELFEHVELGAAYHCPDCMPYEADKDIWVVRKLRHGTLRSLWPKLKRYI